MKSSTPTSNWPSCGASGNTCISCSPPATRPPSSASGRLTKAVKATRPPEPASLFKTLTAWRRGLLAFCRTRITNARTKATNLTARTFKRIGRGYRNHDNYRCRIIGYAPIPVAA